MEVDKDSIRYNSYIEGPIRSRHPIMILGEEFEVINKDAISRKITLKDEKGNAATYRDGQEFINENFDDSNWVWNIDNLDDENPIIGIENDFLWNDASDKGILNENNLGCIELPFNYVGICFEEVV